MSLALPPRSHPTEVGAEVARRGHPTPRSSTLAAQDKLLEQLEHTQQRLRAELSAHGPLSMGASHSRELDALLSSCESLMSSLEAEQQLPTA